MLICPDDVVSSTLLAHAGGFGSSIARAVPMLPTFLHPEWLLLIPVRCAAAWWICRRSLAGGSSPRSGVRLAIRCAVITLLCGALAEPVLKWRTQDVAVVAVMDVSDSIPPDQRRLAEGFLKGSLGMRPVSDRFGLVTVARDALVQSLPTSLDPRLDAGFSGPGDASNLQEGIELACALIPADTGGRLLLLSDGNETDGSIESAASRLITAGVPIDVATVEYDRSDLVRVDELAVPAWARDQDTINARVVLSAGKAARGRLSILLNGVPVDLDPETSGESARIEVAPGTHAMTLRLPLPSGPMHRVEAIFEPEEGNAGTPQLLRAEGITFTSGPGRVLVLADDASIAGPLVSAISSESVKVEVRPGALAPAELAEWSSFDAVVLYDQPASNFSEGNQRNLVRYVRDSGGGLLVVGGPNSFGAGGWIGSTLADVLPVVLDPPQKRQIPTGSMVIVIDRSVSMSAPVAGTKTTQQQIANEAAILGVRALGRLDQVAVIAFDNSAEVVVPLMPCRDTEEISRRIRSIGPAGGTSLFPAIDAAAAELAKAPGGMKHIVILTDGQTMGDVAEGVAKATDLKRRGITISTVAVGNQSNDPLLARLALATDGRFYNVRSENSSVVLPQIFMKEAQFVRRTLIWEGPAFVPKAGFASDALRGIRGAYPAISGYVVTAERGGLSTVSLRGPENDPILAQWQHGLGRVVAYTSDAASRWNPAWMPWESFSPFWNQQMKWLMRPLGDSGANVSVTTRGGKSKVSLELFDPAGDRVNAASIQARMTPPASIDAGAAATRTLSFRQTGAGLYEAEVETETVGTHLLSMRYEAGEGGGAGGSVRAAIINRGGDEMRQSRPSTNALHQIARKTNGRIYKLDWSGANLWVRENLKMPEVSRSIWLAVAIAAIGVFLADIAFRRVALDPAVIRSKVASVWAVAPKATTATLATLATAKARAERGRSIPVASREKTVAGKTSEYSGTFASGADAATQDVMPSSPAATTPHADAEAGSDADVMSRLRAAKRRSRTDGRGGT